MSDFTALVGTGEIKRKYGLDRGQIFRLIASGDWPEPVASLDHGKVWNAEVIDQAVKELRKSGRITKDGRLIPNRYLPKPRARV